MRHPYFRHLPLTLAAAVCLALAPRSARAQWAVFDGSNLAQNIAAGTQRVTQIRNQVTQITLQLQALRKLQSLPFQDIVAPLRESMMLLAETNALGAGVRDLRGEYRMYLQPRRIVADWAEDQRQTGEILYATARNTALVASQQQVTAEDGVTLLERLKLLAGSITGTQQAEELGVLAQLAAAQQLAQMRIMATSSSALTAAFYAHQASVDARAAAAEALWLADGQRNVAYPRVSTSRLLYRGRATP